VGPRFEAASWRKLHLDAILGQPPLPKAPNAAVISNPVGCIIVHGIDPFMLSLTQPRALFLLPVSSSIPRISNQFSY
jgi:hypothetical protein